MYLCKFVYILKIFFLEIYLYLKDEIYRYNIMYVDNMPTSNHRSLSGLQKYYIIMNV